MSKDSAPAEAAREHENSVNAVVSKQELLDAHVEIAGTRLEAAGPS